MCSFTAGIMYTLTVTTVLTSKLRLMADKVVEKNWIKPS